MKPAAEQTSRCSRSTVEVARVENLLRERTSAELADLFTERELEDAGSGPARAAGLAARLAAKEACLQLFPHQTAGRLIQPADFSLDLGPENAVRLMVSPRAQAVLDLHRIAGLRVSLEWQKAAVTGVVWADRRETVVPWFGKLLYHLLPYRRAVVDGNLRRVFGGVLPEKEIERLAQAYYAHYLRFLLEVIRLPFLTTKQRKAWIRIENVESPLGALQAGKGILLLTGHLGNFEVSVMAGLTQFPEYRGKFHFVRRPLKPRWLNRLVRWRYARAGLGILSKRGSLEEVLELLEQGSVIVFAFDQHAEKKDGLAVEFFGHPAGTFKSLALLALSTGAAVVPACTWREPDGTHVVRFEDPLPLIDCDDAAEAVRLNTRAYNEAIERMLLRHPEQWIWMHRRWKKLEDYSQGSQTTGQVAAVRPQRGSSVTKHSTIEARPNVPSACDAS